MCTSLSLHAYRLYRQSLSLQTHRFLSVFCKAAWCVVSLHAQKRIILRLSVFSKDAYFPFTACVSLIDRACLYIRTDFFVYSVKLHSFTPHCCQKRILLRLSVFGKNVYVPFTAHLSLIDRAYLY
jgi:hypothetical protein